MVQTSQSSYTYEIPLPYIILAHNQRYPSPYGTHILSSDVISRSFCPESNVLTTTRLMNKRGKMPKWAPSFISSIGTSWVIEQTQVDLNLHHENEEGERAGELRTRSRNLDHRKILQVEEFQVFTQSPGNSLATDSITYSRITSDLDFWLLRDRVEKYGLSKLPKSISKARLGLNLIATLLLQPSTSSSLLSSGPLQPYSFEPVPSPLSIALRAKLDEARQAWLLDQDPSLLPEDLIGRNDESENGEGVEPGRIWRVRWRNAVKRGKERFRKRVCEVTGLLCDEKSREECGVSTSEGRGQGR
ncbi:Ups1p [Sporobolomyces salmoneus]|uniref:Ups1p n=1 Tax=Sporobolomyces salmoneus TaxID=183962 RepID=UPI00317CEBD9